MAEQKTIRIGGAFAERQRTTSSGTKSRVTMDIKAETVDVNLDEKLLAGPVAVTLKKVLETQIKAISATASPGTLLDRKYAANAFDKDAPWARKRYSGGRTGPKRPGQSDRLFNDSERLAEGLSVRANPKEDTFTINVPANRFDKSTFRSEADFKAMLDQFAALVPGIGKPQTLLEDPRVQKTLKDGLSDVLIHKNAIGSANIAEAVKATTELVQQLNETIDSGNE